MERWQLDRMKAKVDEMAGKLEIKIYTSEGSTYKIWYNPRDDVALYAKLVWDEAKKGERSSKAWPSRILEAVKADTKIQVHLTEDGKRKNKWFGPEADMEPLSQVYRYVIALGKEDDDKTTTKGK